MRALRRLARPTVAAAAAVLLLAGCGGGGNEGSSSATSSASTPSSSAAPSPGDGAPNSDPAVVAFCEQAVAFQAVIAQLPTAAPERIVAVLQESVVAFDAVQPPAEIAADWQALGEGLRMFTDTASTLDLATPEGQQAYQDAANQFVTSASGSGANIEAYVNQNCGTAAPSS